MFVPANHVVEGDTILLHGIAYRVLWVDSVDNEKFDINVFSLGQPLETVMIGIQDTPFVSSNYASFRSSDIVEVSR